MVLFDDLGSFEVEVPLKVTVRRENFSGSTSCRLSRWIKSTTIDAAENKLRY